MILSSVSAVVKASTAGAVTNGFGRRCAKARSSRGMVSLRRINHSHYRKKAKTALDPLKNRHTSSAPSIRLMQYDETDRTLEQQQQQQRQYPTPSEDEEAERLALMRLFLDSLQQATANSTLSNAKSASEGSAGEASGTRMAPTTSADTADDDGTVDYEATEAPSTIRSKEESTGSGASQTPTSRLSTKAESDAPSQSIESVRKSRLLYSALRRSMHREDVKQSMLHFREYQRTGQVLGKTMVTNLFFMVSATDPVSAYSILQYHNLHYLDREQEGRFVGLDSSTNKRLPLYKRMANAVRLLDPVRNNTRRMHILVDSLLKEVEEMDVESKSVLYPLLITSLVTQRVVTVGAYARGLYESMIDHGIEMRVGWLKRLLSASRYNRHNDLPYHDIMQRVVVTHGGRLNGDAALSAIQNMFPFDDTEAVCVALKAWLDDFGNKFGRGDDDDDDDDRMGADFPSSSVPPPEALIALSTLESISNRAAQAGVSQLILLVWDAVEACNYRPTVTIYENTVMAFANERGGLQQAFSSMAAMKEDGFEPSRPLIRGFSSAIRLHRSLIGRARRMLIEDRQNEMSTLDHQGLLSRESLNVVLSSYAERGDPLDAVETLELMSEYDIEPDADSYSFVIEALGRDIKKRLKTNDDGYMQQNVSIADSVLTVMEEKRTVPNTHVIRNYVELLCLAGEGETATSIVEDHLRSTDPAVRNTVNNITIYRVASENADRGNFDRAKSLAARMTERNPALLRRIRSKEQRSLYLQEAAAEAASVGAEEGGKSEPM
eukprot:CAMPEP_0197177728 /NCGR_PEP_ID=MMETSP1423-20130617/3233_1 /TAXON_ID=476441 /ORGANISM="Pseudo-nitzschia heimii, Strain UNC1101" /LENGTH=777 /DNA_ID=CAMNT_0042627327 /DNA_START=238 /DNA_END=2571 /DNA_ORIENTATION=+